MKNKNSGIKTLIIGLGNTLISDDGVGIYVAQECKKLPDFKNATVMEGAMDGITLLNLFTEYDRVIFIDAVQTGKQEAGYIYRVEPEDFNETLFPGITHGIDLVTALELGKKLELTMPGKIVIFAIEAADISTLSETCTPAVREAIPSCIQMIIRELD
jgi:hydrogenase maturation protease